MDLEADFARFLNLLAEGDREQPLPIQVNVMIPAPSRFAETLLEEPHAKLFSLPTSRVFGIAPPVIMAIILSSDALQAPHRDDRGR